ncbi:DUF6993 domain-containing protein [Arthrobacter sp. 2YAF22_2]|uniref:DUF6993 domain-containing protein n=1 Tax=Arthrobacter sp. 2YAF22_2 TaxID=3233029 RepID=UPI003F8E3FB5
MALLPVFGAVGLLLAATSACSATIGGGSIGSSSIGSSSAGGASAAASAPSAPAPAVAARPETPSATPGPATSAARTRMEAALARMAAPGSAPGTDQIRAAIVDAGFPPAAIEVTASRTPTGLAADAVEAAVRQDQDCIVAQLRKGTVAVTVLPLLAGGRCLVGSPA